MPRPKSNTVAQAVCDRRTVLLGSAALATPIAVGNAAEASTPQPTADQSCDYQETDHIRQFYAKCRF